MRVKQLFKYIKADIKKHGGTSIALCVRVYLWDAKFRLLLNYRVGKFYKESRFKPIRTIAHYFKYRQITKRNCQISYAAHLANGVVFKHPLGVVIGENVVIGNNVSIWQQVTIGSHGKPGQELSYPVIEDDVKIFAGAKLFGSITIGKGAIIGANAVVNKSVLPGNIVGGIPAVTLKSNKS